MAKQFTPRLHPDFRYSVDYVGNERNPVLIVDNFMDQADALVELAARYCEFGEGTYFYPGVQSGVPPFYSQMMSYYLGNIICETFNITPQNISHSRSVYSMVLTPPEQLSPTQSRPHVDSNIRSQLASVHYLCSADKGGTSLYRHRATGYETFTKERSEELGSFFAIEAQDTHWQKKYINGSNKYYEQIASYEASFNRLVMYRGYCLHSANIASDFVCDSNPKTGRLTLNTFIHCNE